MSSGVRLQLLTWPIRNDLEPSAWPVVDWLDIERNKNQSRRMTFRELSNLQAAAEILGPQLERADLPGFYVGLTQTR